jgi:O-acetyl-ADP-ribose deacetylase (regulator of RNase III)
LSGNIEHLNRSLGALREFCIKERLTSVALPKLASGVGGLPWSEVKLAIEKHLGGLMVSIYDYDPYAPGNTPVEPV